MCLQEGAAWKEIEALVPVDDEDSERRKEELTMQEFDEELKLLID